MIQPSQQLEDLVRTQQMVQVALSWRETFSWPLTNHYAHDRRDLLNKKKTPHMLDDLWGWESSNYDGLVDVYILSFANKNQSTLTSSIQTNLFKLFDLEDLNLQKF